MEAKKRAKDWLGACEARLCTRMEEGLALWILLQKEMAFFFSISGPDRRFRPEECPPGKEEGKKKRCCHLFSFPRQDRLRESLALFDLSFRQQQRSPFFPNSHSFPAKVSSPSVESSFKTFLRHSKLRPYLSHIRAPSPSFPITKIQ